MTLLEAKAHARRLFNVPLIFDTERGWKVIRVQHDSETPFLGGCKGWTAGTELGRGGSWLEAMRCAALAWTQSVSEQHLREKSEIEEKRCGRSSDQPLSHKPGQPGAAPGPAILGGQR